MTSRQSCEVITWHLFIRAYHTHNHCTIEKKKSAVLICQQNTHTRTHARARARTHTHTHTHKAVSNQHLVKTHKRFFSAGHQKPADDEWNRWLKVVGKRLGILQASTMSALRCGPENNVQTRPVSSSQRNSCVASIENSYAPVRVDRSELPTQSTLCERLA